MNDKLTTILAELRRRFEVLYSTRLVEMMLFGSQARGDAGALEHQRARCQAEADVQPHRQRRPREDQRHPDQGTETAGDGELHHNEVVSCVFVSAEQFERERSPLLLNIRREGVPI